ncbi:hypothetical protein PG994_005289 [Apiospora phragmitis]|uniref:Uncharacterized protein n=1 Tax=Apiospora phragmitis TaxID=2905665 RepID=A0ABR1VFK3_9PEZI
MGRRNRRHVFVVVVFIIAAIIFFIVPVVGGGYPAQRDLRHGRRLRPRRLLQRPVQHLVPARVVPDREPLLATATSNVVRRRAAGAVARKLRPSTSPGVATCSTTVVRNSPALGAGGRREDHGGRGREDAVRVAVARVLRRRWRRRVRRGGCRPFVLQLDPVVGFLGHSGAALGQTLQQRPRRSAIAKVPATTITATLSSDLLLRLLELLVFVPVGPHEQDQDDGDDDVEGDRDADDGGRRETLVAAILRGAGRRCGGGGRGG